MLYVTLFSLKRKIDCNVRMTWTFKNMILLLSNLESILISLLVFNRSEEEVESPDPSLYLNCNLLSWRVCYLQMIASFCIASLQSLPLSLSYYPQSGSLTFPLSVPSSENGCSLQSYHTGTSFIFPMFLSALSARSCRHVNALLWCYPYG